MDEFPENFRTAFEDFRRVSHVRITEIKIMLKGRPNRPAGPKDVRP